MNSSNFRTTATVWSKKLLSLLSSLFAVRNFAFLLFFLFLTAGIATAYSYYQVSRATIERLRESKARLEFVVKSQDETIRMMREDHRRTTEALIRVNQTIERSQRSARRLQGALYRERRGKTSLDDLAILVPEKIEYRANTATKRLFKSLEEISSKK